jgi:hypothetical protein
MTPERHKTAMEKFEVEGVQGKLPPEFTAAKDAVEEVLRLYRRTPFPLIGKHRDGLASQCAFAALVAAGYDVFSDDG